MLEEHSLVAIWVLGWMERHWWQQGMQLELGGRGRGRSLGLPEVEISVVHLSERAVGQMG